MAFGPGTMITSDQGDADVENWHQVPSMKEQLGHSSWYSRICETITFRHWIWAPSSRMTMKLATRSVALRFIRVVDLAELVTSFVEHRDNENGMK